MSYTQAGTVLSVFVLLAAASMYAFSGFAAADDHLERNDTVVNVTVEEQVEVTVRPDMFNFTDMDLETTDFEDTADNQLDIENTGSVNVTDVYAHVNTFDSEYENPLGSGSADSYAAGGFVWIKNSTSNFYHAGTQMWNITERAGGQPSGIEEEPTDTVSYGYYRNATGDYLWALTTDYGSEETDPEGPLCNDEATDVTLEIMDNPDTGDNRNFDEETSVYNLHNGVQDGDWSQNQADDGPLEGHYVAAYEDCERLYVNRFDSSDMFPMTGGEDQYLVGGEDDGLAPGDTYTARLGAAIPSGIPAGVTNSTTLTVHASSANGIE